RYNSHNQTALVYLEGCYKAGKTDIAEKVRKDLRRDLEQQKKYMDYLKTQDESYFKSLSNEYEINERMLIVLEAIEKKYAPQTQTNNKVETNGGQITTQAADSSKKDSNK
ncbi:MAG: hypothetical protein JSU05_12000, partial [Bacteroidetes bacterium]|nr:hypothetical protein [Bacteroidota bacterium]